MSTGNSSYDVIVIGGGFAGVTAARDAHDNGRSVLLLEARDRLGGRTWYRPFRDTAQHVEFGGTWLGARHSCRYAYGEVERYGLDLVQSPDAGAFASYVAGRRIDGPLPVPREQLYEFERGLSLVAAASREVDYRPPLGSRGLHYDIPCTDFLAQFDLPRETAEYMLAWVHLYFGVEADRVSALHMLAQIAALHFSCLGLMFTLVDKFKGGTKRAIETIVADSEADVRLSTPVTRVSQDGSSVTVKTASGERFRAAAAVCAAPLNCWESIEFDPRLNETKRIVGRQRQPSHSVKVWALTRGLPHEYFYAVGMGEGLDWVSTEYVLSEGSLVIGFAPSRADFDQTSVTDVERAMRLYAPDAEVLAIDSHDWNSDPYSNGSWMAYRPGWLTRYVDAMREPEGRIVFAGSDIALGFSAGWIDGAIQSGIAAAAEVEHVLRGVTNAGAVLAAGKRQILETAGRAEA
jgi:monoamine oxidase